MELGPSRTAVVTGGGSGHRWAAEAILEWLKRNPEACD